ncbi:transmembrane protein 209-like [Dysidea avara]|uniref:transmembrane protein 209-like n=1 Tax=Dysidea avara TaxID=196820 RepID=UPI00332F1A72
MRRRLGPGQNESLQYNISKRVISDEAKKTKKKLFICLGLSIIMYPLPVSWCFSSPGSWFWYLEYMILVLASFFTTGYLMLFLWLKLPLPQPKVKSTTLATTTATPTYPYSHPHMPLQQLTPQPSSHSMTMSPSKQFYPSTPTGGGSPFSNSDCINDFKSLDNYLKSEEEREQLLFRASPAASTANWNGTSPHMDVSPAISSYHVATRRSPGFKDDDSMSGMVWESNPLGIKEDDLDRWTERCRKWLSQTVLARLVKEVNSINDKLTRIGCSELQIGTVSMSTLRQIAVDKIEHVPTLGQVMPYLDITSKQDYLVKRLRELAKGDSLAAFYWNTGGTWANREWDQDLPTDSQIVMHLLCSYMDGHLPPNPQHPNGRVFSSQYFLKCPHKPDDKKMDICIYQSSSYPPHYQLLLQNSIVDVPKGRNNLFHCIIYFLHCIKTKQNGMLGQINLGLAGINILWIISKK